MQEVNKNPELQLDENADWMTLILMSTLRALIGLELDRVVLFKLSNEVKYKTKQKLMNAIIEYPYIPIYKCVLWCQFVSVWCNVVKRNSFKVCFTFFFICEMFTTPASGALLVCYYFCESPFPAETNRFHVLRLLWEDVDAVCCTAGSGLCQLCQWGLKSRYNNTDH